jgi:hypothetical protein
MKPTPNSKSRRQEEDGPPTRDRDHETVDPPTEGAGLSDLSDKQLLKKQMRYTEEFQMLGPDQSTAAMNRRVELTRLLRAVQDVRDAREELVEIRVPRSVTGEPFVVGPKEFPPGFYTVRASVAQYLLWMIAENQRIEMNRLKSNGREIDLGSIGGRARMAERISRDDGSDDWVGRGR